LEAQKNDIWRGCERLDARRAEGEEEMSDIEASRHREIACSIIIDTSGHFLLQQRDEVAGIVHPGKVGLFGGHREGDETYLECVVREVHEELSYFVPAERFEYLASLDGSDIEVVDGTVSAEFFITRDIPSDALVVTEGSLLKIKSNEIIEIEHKLTPSARFALRVYFDKFLAR
jgi:8-oxo-dGTP diphosphatase